MYNTTKLRLQRLKMAAVLAAAVGLMAIFCRYAGSCTVCKAFKNATAGSARATPTPEK
ncbi:MAG: hypothetical protein LBS63_03160 [Prevotellaceae bacterium]|nr:hypothetical protein [Prevotellaceae bacterium]